MDSVTADMNSPNGAVPPWNNQGTNNDKVHRRKTSGPNQSSLGFFLSNRDKSFRCSNLHQSFSASSSEASPSTTSVTPNFSLGSGLLINNTSSFVDPDEDDDDMPLASSTNLSGTNILSTPRKTHCIPPCTTPNSCFAAFSRQQRSSYSPSPTRFPLKSIHSVHRRKSLLPKPKTFQRVARALQEEAAPLQTEMFHEAAISRLFQESQSSCDNIFANKQQESSFTLHRKPHENLFTNDFSSSEAMSQRQSSKLAERSSNDIPLPQYESTDVPTPCSSMGTPVRSTESFIDIITTPLSSVSRTRKRGLDDSYIDSCKRRAVSPSLLSSANPASLHNSPRLNSNLARRSSSIPITDTREVLMNLKL
ncbi:hypothetical protein SJAG_01486 [Schizosaccharomyces japonicus yFS275]|uniref:Uncharacterized protein n=1 Tax=Schizosaccharomyces japonicus (strain yFS275 / FY16936) TaxID=402676 RepID=B6JY27_SCHJY|nr:hypothetical protein SJAG_01486 [Schizosaccharomyces japonicus yFS275]EEB06445.1 hypothetical protein SJAG_01486 [Schizosaccharomyces japonicus yFS275]